MHPLIHLFFFYVLPYVLPDQSTYNYRLFFLFHDYFLCTTDRHYISTKDATLDSTKSRWEGVMGTGHYIAKAQVVC